MLNRTAHNGTRTMNDTEFDARPRCWVNVNFQTGLNRLPSG